MSSKSNSSSKIKSSSNHLFMSFINLNKNQMLQMVEMRQAMLQMLEAMLQMLEMLEMLAAMLEMMTSNQPRPVNWQSGERSRKFSLPLKCQFMSNTCR